MGSILDLGSFLSTYLGASSSSSGGGSSSLVLLINDSDVLQITGINNGTLVRLQVVLLGKLLGSLGLCGQVFLV
jgi:hypothetical protein